ncbi:MAG: hypothetical protein MPK75_02065 [Alphaproteobacteria bacterium]|nr:hypothetical protein [Alphaproteobacteria bacterium]
MGIRGQDQWLGKMPRQDFLQVSVKVLALAAVIGSILMILVSLSAVSLVEEHMASELASCPGCVIGENEREFYESSVADATSLVYNGIILGISSAALYFYAAKKRI